MTFKLQAISHSAHFPEKYRKTWSSDEKCGNNLIGMWFNLIWVLIEYLVWGRLEEDPGVPTDYWTVHNLGNRRFEGFDKQKRNQLERSRFKPELWASLSRRHTQACNSTGSQSWRWTLCCLDPWDITSELVPDKSCVSTYDLTLSDAGVWRLNLGRGGEKHPPLFKSELALRLPQKLFPTSYLAETKMFQQKNNHKVVCNRYN